MPEIKEAELNKVAKLPNIGVDQPIFNRQTTDAIKQLNFQQRILQNRLRALEDPEEETFKYLKGNLNADRTTPNINGEIEFKSSNNTINSKVDDYYVDLMAKNLVRTDGTEPLTDDWDVGDFSITAEQFISDIAIGTSPLIVTSTTLVDNLNADMVDGFHHDQSLLTTASPTFNALGINEAVPQGAIHLNKGFGLANGIVLGDGDSGIYEVSDDTIGIWLAGALRVRFIDTAGIYLGNSSAFPRIALSDGSTLPNFTPVSGDSNTGVGWASADILKFYAGGQAWYLAESANIANLHARGDNFKITFGAADDVGEYFNGTDYIKDFDLLNAGTTDYRIQQFAVDRLTILASGKVGISTSTPTAWLHLPAGLAAAGGAPLKFAAGTLLTTPEAGAMEFDGTGAYLTNTNHRRFVSLAADSIISTVTATTVAPTTVWTGITNANELKARRVYVIRGCGLVNNLNAAAVATITFDFGATTLITFTTPGAKLTNDEFHFRIMVTIRSIGAGGDVSAFAMIMVDATTGTKTQHSVTETIAVDSTIANNATMNVVWSAADASNWLKLTQCYMKEED